MIVAKDLGSVNVAETGSVNQSTSFSQFATTYSTSVWIANQKALLQMFWVYAIR